MKLELLKSCLRIVGAIDRYTLIDPQLFNFPQFDKEVTIDLQQVSSVDTAGVAYLLKVVAYYQNKNVITEITNPPSQLIALAEISNVLGLLPLKK